MTDTQKWGECVTSRSDLKGTAKENSSGKRRMIPDGHVMIQEGIKRTRKDKNVVPMWVKLMNIECFTLLIK